MVDQRVGESERYPFFNKPAHTTTIPAQLALKFELRYYSYIYWKERRQYF